MWGLAKTAHVYFTGSTIQVGRGWVSISAPKPEWQHDLLLQKFISPLKTPIYTTKFPCLLYLKVEIYQGALTVNSFRALQKLYAKFYVYKGEICIFQGEEFSRF